MGSPADVEVLFRETSALAAADIAAAIAVLSDDERAQCERFQFAESARDYAAAHALLRTMLSRGTDRPPRSWQFDRTGDGKPFLAGGDGTSAPFSLSHTRGMVACAVSAGAEVGVDLERIDRAVDDAVVSARFFAPAEAAALERLDERRRRDRFFDLWTLKEALVKALGHRLAAWSHRLAFDVDALDAGIAIVSSGPPEFPAHQWQFELFSPAPGYRGAVAARRGGGPPLQVTIRSADPDRSR